MKIELFLIFLVSPSSLYLLSFCWFMLVLAQNVQETKDNRNTKGCDIAYSESCFFSACPTHFLLTGFFWVAAVL